MTRFVIMIRRPTHIQLTRFHVQPRRLLSKASALKPSGAPTPALRSDAAVKNLPQNAARARILRLNARLPRFLHRYTAALGTAPVTHVTSFLLLHELTAIAPLFGLAAFFHYTNWLPAPFVEGKFVVDGVERFGRYARRKGWLGEGEAQEAGAIAKDNARSGGGKTARSWGQGEGGVRLLVEFATAYAITKALLPLRIMLSLWATPWFARWTVVPAMNGFKRVFGKSKSKATSSG